MSADCFERRFEPLGHLFIHLADNLIQRRFRLHQIILLPGKELEALLDALIFLDGAEIHLAQRRNLPLQVTHSILSACNILWNRILLLRQLDSSAHIPRSACAAELSSSTSSRLTAISVCRICSSTCRSCDALLLRLTLAILKLLQALRSGRRFRSVCSRTPASSAQTIKLLDLADRLLQHAAPAPLPAG